MAHVVGVDFFTSLAEKKDKVLNDACDLELAFISELRLAGLDFSVRRKDYKYEFTVPYIEVVMEDSSKEFLNATLHRLTEEKDGS